MERLKALFPTLAHMEPLEIALLPVAAYFLACPIVFIVHKIYVSMGWVAN